MSNLPIFESRWIDLVFEGRNQQYGAYQLRQENSKTTVKAFFVSLVFIATIISVFTALNYFNPSKTVVPTIYELPPITTVVYPAKPPVEPKKEMLPPVKKQETQKSETAKSAAPMEVGKKEEDKGESTKNSNYPADSSSENTDSSNGTASESGASSASNGDATIETSGALKDYELDKSPQFPGGVRAFLNYVGKNYKTPDLELEKTVRIFVSFIVEKDGTISTVEVKNDPGFGLGKEAIRVLKALKTKWEPGIKNGKPVRAYYNLPITIVTN